MTSTISSWITVGWTAIGIFLSGAFFLLALPWALPNLFPGPGLPKDVTDILNNADIGKIRDDLEALRRAVEALLKAVPAGEAPAETLQDILASTRDEVSALMAASVDLASALTSFTGEVRAMTGASTDLVGELMATRSEVDALREEVQRLRTVVATLVDALSEVSSELQLLRTDASKIQRAGNSPLRSHLGQQGSRQIAGARRDPATLPDHPSDGLMTPPAVRGGGGQCRKALRSPQRWLAPHRGAGVY